MLDDFICFQDVTVFDDFTYTVCCVCALFWGGDTHKKTKNLLQSGQPKKAVFGVSLFCFKIVIEILVSSSVISYLIACYQRYKGLSFWPVYIKTFIGVTGLLTILFTYF